jgi:excinuclease ABC subunit A
MAGHIEIRGARQHNLKGFDLRLPLNELIVVTGVSGSGKSSLAFDTLYAEGQRRYVETFSPYARQFLDRMDRPRVDAIEGIPPAIAIDQTNPVRSSRSTVGTMTELNDHLKLLYARAAELFCGGCGRVVRRDSAASIWESLQREWPAPAAGGPAPEPEALITFPVAPSRGTTAAQMREVLASQGYARVLDGPQGELNAVQDRLKWRADRRARVVDDLEAALGHGGRVDVHRLDAAGAPERTWRFSSDLHCPDCDRHYADPTPNLFSFNSPLGACSACRGFGRVIGIDYGLVVPDERLSLAKGAIRPWNSDSYRECRDDLVRFARQRGVPVDVPWSALTEVQRAWVLEGEGEWEDGKWYGVRRFFSWLETKSYRMHIRVLLSRYRTYQPCPACGGARLKPEALLWRVRGGADGGTLSLRDLVQLPIDAGAAFFAALALPAPLDDATAVLVDGIRTRLRYLVDVGLGYLTLDRQSRTLSGGEVQRINLTTALGTSLVNTLFVLDEPSIGLHPRDIGRLIGVLHRLRDLGNTLLVVEHDPDVIRAADRVLDMGPGPGERGGEVVYFGPLAGLASARGSLTADYLCGRRSAVPPEAAAGARPPREAGVLAIRGARAHNLRRVDAEIPLNRLVCVTGVSGSGKSSLVHDVLYLALCKQRRRAVETPGEHDAIEGGDRIDDVVLVDQSPIGKTARSNPCSYVGAFDGVRRVFATQPLAVERGYTAGAFSFNSSMRCPACGGSGFEHVEMQFLSDVYLRCPECDGRRYRPEVLEVRLTAPAADGKGLRSLSIADVLELTIEEAVALFAGETAIAAALEPLIAVGLGYLRMGQPVPTLSGGEAQRLKLAAHLKGTPARQPGGTLFLFDEPTTGLHFDDIRRFLGALRRLLDAGHSVVVIEHNLDVMRAADWLIDLGPEGGDAGGRIVCAGTPGEVAAVDASHTGQALRRAGAQAGLGAAVPSRGRRGAGKRAPPDERIRIRGAREHNLKNIDLDIPRDRLTVITGVSGSGKSTVAFDLLFAEGQRRYLESLNAYARQFVQPVSRPEADAVTGVPPTVAIEQRTSRGGWKSTVATVTGVQPFLRLLYARLGTLFCPDCDVAIARQSLASVQAEVQRRYRGRRVQVLAPLVTARKGYYTDLAKWAARQGVEHLRVDGEPLPTAAWPRLDRYREHTIEMPVARIDVQPAREQELAAALAAAAGAGNGVVLILREPVGPGAKADVFSTRQACPSCGRGFAELDPRLFSFNSAHGWCPRCAGTGMRGGQEASDGAEEADRFDPADEAEAQPCPACRGRRLRPEALAVRFRDLSIAEIGAMTVSALDGWFARLSLGRREREIARDLVAEIRSRLAFLDEVGLAYLGLDRPAPTLSGGEARRIRLAAQLGSNLRGVCYILDEPTIGLHARDNRMLLDTLAALRARGNTVVVVEHDEDTIRRADHVIDLGPGGGVRGGRVVAAGTPAQLARSRRSVTARCLAEPMRHPLGGRERRACRTTGKGAEALTVRKARMHNLAGVNAAFPVGRLVVVTGVSGSGKSTLVRDILHRNLAAWIHSRGRGFKAQACAAIEGIERVRRVLEVDQTPIGKTPRSCPATYVGFWDDVRRLFAATPEARMRAYTASRFSFNVAGGRCAECEGQGLKRLEMSFLPDVAVTCEACGGRRFTPETLEVRYGGRSVAEVLAMNVDEAVEFFAPHASIHHALSLLCEVGLGYLTLGQQSPTLSGGEAQRIKLVTELARVNPVVARLRSRGGVGETAATPLAGTVYVLDEPTIGLHMADVEKLIGVLQRLVDFGATVIVIEHNLDLIAEADWVIDLGPEGGDAGGRVVAAGPPPAIAGCRASHTGQFLVPFLARGEQGPAGGGAQLTGRPAPARGRRAK